MLFFWKQCKTNTASSNFTVYTARYVPPASSILNDLKHAGTAKAFEYLGRIVLVAVLRQRQGIAEEAPHHQRQSHQILVAAANPFERLLVVARHVRIIHEQVYDAARWLATFTFDGTEAVLVDYLDYH